jgi:antitoxin component YwqK of YwqJK toxin-antitoxin module
LQKTIRNGQQVNRNTYSFDDQFRLISIVDSSRDIKSNTKYTYNNDGNIVSVVTTTNDSLNDFSQSTAHYYLYNETGKPVALWRVINGTDSTEFRFKLDEKGNVTDEQLYRRGVALDLTYYYYDDRNRVTDIVRYDKRTKKLLPVFMFEYDESGRLIQKMSVLSINRPDYIIWRYIFNEKGLKTKEALFNKQKELTGRIEYAYTFEK